MTYTSVIALKIRSNYRWQVLYLDKIGASYYNLFWSPKRFGDFFIVRPQKARIYDKLI